MTSGWRKHRKRSNRPEHGSRSHQLAYRISHHWTSYRWSIHTLRSENSGGARRSRPPSSFRTMAKEFPASWSIFPRAARAFRRQIQNIYLSFSCLKSLLMISQLNANSSIGVQIASVCSLLRHREKYRGGQWNDVTFQQRATRWIECGAAV